MSASASAFRTLKILIVGDKDTGKHCYVRRLIDNKYPRDRWTNKECDVWQLRIKFDQDTEIAIQLFIIQGAARGKTILKKYYKSIDGYIIVFDVTNPESYDNIIPWKDNVDAVHPSNRLPPSIVLANKCDLERDKDVEEQMKGIEGFCEAFNFRAHYEVSSKDNIGIEESFKHLIREILNSPQSPPPPAPSPPEGEHTSRSPTTSESESQADPVEKVERSLSITKQEHVIKIIVIGDLATGKTAMIRRYVRNNFSAHYLTTIGADVALKKLAHHNDILNVHIWDIAGDERFGSMTHVFYKDAAGCLIVFDQSKISSLNGAVKWKEDFDLKVNFDENNPIPCILAGNKCDLPKDGLIQSETHMEEFWKTHRFLRWFETSAKESMNINETFAFLINAIMENLTRRNGIRTRTVTSTGFSVHDEPLRTYTNNSCCNT